MKKIFAIASVFVIAITSYSINPITVFAEDTQGHHCAGSQCISCTIHEDGCLEGACNAFTCDGDDATPPITPIITNTDQLLEINKGSSIRVRGYGESNSRIIFIIDGEEINEASVGGDSTFDVTFDPRITVDGEHKLQAYLRDSAGNESDISEEYIVNIDAVAPAIDIESIPDFIAFENVLISGSTEPNSSILVTKGRKEVYKTGSDENGNFDLVLNLEDGKNEFTLVITDTVGNKNEKEISVVYDEANTSLLELLSSKNGVLTFSVPEGVVVVEVYKNGVLLDTIQINETEFTYDISGQMGGISNKFEFIGIDAAGNKTKETTYSKTSSGQLIIIIVGLIVTTSLIGLIIYLIKTGKLVLPYNKKKASPEQTKFKIEEKEGNIKPGNIRKEY